MTVEEAKERVDSREFAQWRAIFELDPWTSMRADAGFARVCQTMAAMHGVSTELKQFMPSFEQQSGPKLGDRVLHVFAAAAAVARARNGKA